jgi:hypothetical protein
VPTAGTACFLAVAVLVLAGWLVPLSSVAVSKDPELAIQSASGRRHE